MGFLAVFEPADWPEALTMIPYVKEHGVIQFVNSYLKWKSLKKAQVAPTKPLSTITNDTEDNSEETYSNVGLYDLDCLRWGDEIEYMIVKNMEGGACPRLLLEAQPLLQTLEAAEPQDPNNLWRAEYGDFMIEGTPGKPYSLSMKDLHAVYSSMTSRRARLREETVKVCPDGGDVTSFACFPMLGALNEMFAEPEFTQVGGDATESIFIPDSVIARHPRYQTLARNIRQRKKAKVVIAVPLFIDECTPPELRGSPSSIEYDVSTAPWDISTRPERQAVYAPFKDMIYMDAMAFGAGCSCLQTTFEMPSLEHARYVHDIIGTIGPVILALTASAPFWRGLVASTDTRWVGIETCGDCRTQDEMDYIRKSRWQSIETYLGLEKAKEFNDIDFHKDEKALGMLKTLTPSIDSVYADHIAHLFIRDPIVIFHERLKQVDDESETDHFENIQSTNWSIVRLKPPPLQNPHQIGWRVELRSPDVQITDFENSAFAQFSAILVRALLKKRPNFYITISQLDENMTRSANINAVVSEKFYWPASLASVDEMGNPEIVEKSVAEIMLDPEMGLLQLCREEVDNERSRGKLSDEASQQLTTILKFIELRCRGSILTGAAYMRMLLHQHTSYKKDSVVPADFAAELCKLVCSLGNETRTSHLSEIASEMFAGIFD